VTRKFVVGLLLCLVSAHGVSVAHAQTSGGGELGPGYVRATAADLGAGTFPGGGLPTSAPSLASLVRWVTSTEPTFCVISSSPLPPDIVIPARTFDPAPFVGAPPGTIFVGSIDHLPPDAVVVGPILLDLGVSLRTGEIVIAAYRCGGPSAPAPPIAPSSAEIWEETPLPRAVVQASPPGTRDWPGITRLGTDFSSPPLPATSAFVALHGFDVDVTAVPIAYAWSFGDGTTVITGDPNAITRVAYLRRGEFPVTRYVVWHGTARMTLFGRDLGEQDLGTVTIPERIPYRVSEIRAVLRTTRGRG
jgi:hypothetical protein